MTRGVKKIVVKEKKMFDYNARMKDIMKLTNPVDQLTEVKKLLNIHKEETKRMSTKVIKLEKDLEKSNKSYQDAINMKVAPPKQALAPGQIQSGGTAQLEDESEMKSI